MAVKASDGKNSFLSVDRCWNGQSFLVVFPAKYQIQAQEFVEYAAKYLQHEHGEAVFRWFTSDAIAEAKEMGWDEHLHHPISQDGLDLKEDLKRLDFEWCIPNEAPNKPKLPGDTPVDMDNLSLPSFQTLTGQAQVAHPAGPCTQVKSPPPTATPTTHQSTATVMSDNLTMESTIATRLSALEVNWSLILQCLDKLADLGKTPNISDTRSTSTSTDPLSLGPAQPDQGARV